jgi:hypothetical protein
MRICLFGWLVGLVGSLRQDVTISGWLQTQEPPVSTSQELGLQVCATMPCFEDASLNGIHLFKILQ